MKRLATPVRPMIVLALLAGCDRDAETPTKTPAKSAAAITPAAETPGSAAGATAGPSATPWFTDATDELGLDFVHDPGQVDRYRMPQIMASGLATFDYNGDGRMDLYLLNNGGPQGRPNQLFRQEPDGTFANASAGSGTDISGFCIGATAGDLTNDGRPDLVVSRYSGVNVLVNRGDGKFVDVTAASGVSNPEWAVAGSMFDYDRDGWLDLLIVNYVLYSEVVRCSDSVGNEEYCFPARFDRTVCRLFRNLGASADGEPRFQDVSQASGLASSPGWGMACLTFDADDDGWTDIFVTNDGPPNHLFINQKDGTFREEGMLRGIGVDMLGKPQGNMGAAAADLLGDGRMGVYVPHLTEDRHVMWVSDGGGFFLDRTLELGLGLQKWPSTGFGPILADFENDGDIDVAVTSGRIARPRVIRPDAGTVDRLGTRWAPYAERNTLFAQDAGRFRDVSQGNPAFCGLPNVARGLISVDLDNDGGLELVYSTIGDRARIMRNTAADRGHWLTVRAVLPEAGGRDAHNAAVRVYAGDRVVRGWVMPAQSYGSSVDPRVHLGLGEAATYDRVEVTWPDASAESFDGGAADRMLTLAKGSGNPLVQMPR